MHSTNPFLTVESDGALSSFVHPGKNTKKTDIAEITATDTSLHFIVVPPHCSLNVPFSSVEERSLFYVTMRPPFLSMDFSCKIIDSGIHITVKLRHCVKQEIRAADKKRNSHRK